MDAFFSTLGRIGDVRIEDAVVVRPGASGDRLGSSEQFLSQAPFQRIGGLCHEKEKIDPPRLADALLIALKNLLLLAFRKSFHRFAKCGRHLPYSFACDHVMLGIKTVDLGAGMRDGVCVSETRPFEFAVFRVIRFEVKVSTDDRP
jgi:hypothetical protein